MAVAGFSNPLAARQTTDTPAGAEPPDWRDEIWNSNELYQNEGGPGIDSFSLIGRYHGQYWSVDADQGDTDGWENRRVIFGFNAALSETFSAEAQIHINDEFDSPLYDGLYVGFVRWRDPEQKLAVSLGRLDYTFTGLERTTSSKKMATFERGQAVNQVMPGEVFGLYSRETKGKFHWQAGLFSGEIGDEFTDFSGGYAALVGLGWDLPLFSFDEGLLHLDYLYNDGNPGNSAFEPYGNIVSLWHQGRKGTFGLGVDLTLTTGLEDRSDLFALTLLPTWVVAESLLIDRDLLQLALRYQYSESRDAGGLQPQRRYEQEVATGDGDHYQAFYAGLNYLIHGNRLQLMAGAEYAQMRDRAGDTVPYRGWTWFGGGRLYF